ncbi:hypothetical protein BDQ17DRAFT_947141 [Cyathus striatus]|nr:hypothetical protein BDQ17DRAFT_947141 [Cyathus striatus]
MSQTHPRLAQSIWASVLNGPDPTVDPIRWNSVWERRIKDDSLTRCAIELMISGYGDQAETLLTLIRYNTRFLVEMQHILTSSYRGDGFNQKWKATTTSERRKHMLEGLVRSTIINPDTEADRVFCSDITLDALDKEDGEPFIKLVEAYVAPDVSKLMTETVRSYPHPKWGDELKMEHERDKTSMKSLALDMLQSKRDLYICRFIDGTLESFIDVPRRPIQVVETKPRSRKRNKFRKEASEKLKDFERIIGKDILKEVTKRWMNDRSDTVRACEFCCKLEDPAHLLKRCQRCLSSVQRKIHYCSPDCQRSDWSVHKKICGKLLTTETVKSISILPPINERFKLSPPKLPHTTGETSRPPE